MKKIGEIYNAETAKNYCKTAEGREKNEPDALLESLIPEELKGKIVIDLGCGDGRYSEIFCQRGAEKVIGIDLNGAMIAWAKERKAEKNLNQLDLVRSDIEQLPIGENKVDYVFSRFSLMYSDRLENVLGNISHALNSDGEVLIETSVANIKNSNKLPEIKREAVPLILSIGENKVRLKNFAYTLDDYLAAFKKAGFKVELSKEFPADDLSVSTEYADKDEIKFMYGVFKLKKLEF